MTVEERAKALRNQKLLAGSVQLEERYQTRSVKFMNESFVGATMMRVVPWILTAWVWIGWSMLAAAGLSWWILGPLLGFGVAASVALAVVAFRSKKGHPWTRLRDRWFAKAVFSSRMCHLMQVTLDATAKLQVLGLSRQARSLERQARLYARRESRLLAAYDSMGGRRGEMFKQFARGEQVPGFTAERCEALHEVTLQVYDVWDEVSLLAASAAVLGEVEAKEVEAKADREAVEAARRVMGPAVPARVSQRTRVLAEEVNARQESLQAFQKATEQVRASSTL